MAYSKAQLALQAHINAENEKALEAGACMTTTSDLDHWASYDIFTIDQYEHYMASAAYIDTYKEINGIKPRWINFDAMTTAQINAELDDMLEAELRKQTERSEAQTQREQALAHNNRYRPNNPFSDLGALMGK